MSELPDLGKHCGVASCNQLDFLPMRCDICCANFCATHHPVGVHACPGQSTATTDVRVPVCPVCDQPVPVNRGEDPNRKMDEHISSGCVSPKAARTYENACSKPKCKNREAIRINCPTCKQQFCLTHRFESAHACPGKANAAAAAAQRRQQQQRVDRERQLERQAKLRQQQQQQQQRQSRGPTRPQQTHLSHVGRDLNAERATRVQQQQQQQQQQRSVPVATSGAVPPPEATPGHPHYNEDAALAWALQQSVDMTRPHRTEPQPEQQSCDVM